jgi:hypothetical protein
MAMVERSSARDRALSDSRPVAFACCPSHRGQSSQDEKYCGAAFRNSYRLDGVKMAWFGPVDDVPIGIAPAQVFWGFRNH